MKIGLALSGGGARGVAHIGVIKALEELGLEFSIISGTSAGSIIGAMYAYGYKPLHILEIIKEISIFKSVRPAWNWSGLLTMDGMKELLFKYMPNNSFEKLKIPLTIAATEIRIGEIRYFSEGELIPAIMASCTIPAVFSPMVLKDGLYVDGGVFDNLPAKVIRGKCDFVIGSHCNQIPREFDPKNMKVVIERTLLMAINANTQISKSYCDVFIEPTGLGKYGSFEIGKAQEIFDFAYAYTKENFQRNSFSFLV
jgi:NTE family protein